MRLLMALALCFACLAAPAKADESCLDEWATLRADAVAHDWRLVEITGIDAARFVANYNATALQSDLQADMVAVIRPPEASAEAVIFVRKGCMVDVNFAPPAIVEMLFTDIPGDPA